MENKSRPVEGLPPQGGTDGEEESKEEREEDDEEEDQEKEVGNGCQEEKGGP